MAELRKLRSGHSGRNNREPTVGVVYFGTLFPQFWPYYHLRGIAGRLFVSRKCFETWRCDAAGGIFRRNYLQM